MKLLILILFIFLALPATVSAHLIGQPPFFKVNGAYSIYYPVPSTSLSDFYLPQDATTQPNFLAGEAINFEIDTKALPVPPEIVEKTKFIWSFGDGENAEGLQNQHTYQKPGTYFMEIKADSGEGFEPQLLQSTAINVLPDSNYKLPKAIIEVNKKSAKDPLIDVLETDFSKDVSFDGSKSDPGSSEIVEYFWDLGNQTSKTGASFKYKYQENPYAVFPVLRIKTKDGFIADSYVQLSEPFQAAGNTPKSTFLNIKIIAGAALAAFILTAGIFFTYYKFFNKRRG